MFMTVLGLTFISLVASIVCLIKRRKFGNKPLLTFAALFVVGLVVSIPLGNQPVSSTTDESQPAVSQSQETSQDKVVNTIGTIDQTSEDLQKEPMFTTKEIAASFKKSIGKQITPTQAYETFAQGFTVTSTGTHEYTFLNTKKDGSYVVVTFNEAEDSVVKVNIVK